MPPRAPATPASHQRDLQRSQPIAVIDTKGRASAALVDIVGYLGLLRQPASIAVWASR